MKVNLPTLVIANGGTESDALDYQDLRHVESLTIFGPSALTGVATVEVAPTRTPVAADWVALQSGGADVTITADKATTIHPGVAQALRIVSSAAEGAERSFPVIGHEG